MRNKNVYKPPAKDVTGDEACLRRVQLEMLRVISSFKNQRIDCLGLCDDGRCEPLAIERGAHNERASAHRTWNSNRHASFFWGFVFWEKDVDTISVGMQ